MLERDSMLFWLANAAVQAREAAGRKQVHIAASANRDQSSIYRFEQAAKGKGGWPRDADRIVAAYADDLDVDSMALWETALQLWRADRAREPERIIAAEGQGLAQGATQAGEALRGETPRPRRAASKQPPKRTPQA